MEKMFLLQAQVPHRYLHEAMIAMEDCEGRAIMVRPLRIQLANGEPAQAQALPAPTNGLATGRGAPDGGNAGRARAAILARMAESEPFSPQDIVAMGHPRNAVSMVLYQLKKDGVIKSVGVALYAKVGVAVPPRPVEQVVAGGPARNAILQALREGDAPITVKGLVAAGVGSHEQITNAFYHLKKIGVVKLIAKGTYARNDAYRGRPIERVRKRRPAPSNKLRNTGGPLATAIGIMRAKNEPISGKELLASLHAAGHKMINVWGTVYNLKVGGYAKAAGKGLYVLTKKGEAAL